MTAMSDVARPELSAVIPCLNEEENVDAIAAAVGAELGKLDCDYEIIFIDNGSTDRTVELIKAICSRDERVRLIVNTRNFGQMRSPTHGIYQASAIGAVIGISADFQDPPEMIGQLVAAWRAGAMIVLAVRASEKTSLVLRLARAIGYGFFERFGDYRVIPGATGFGLYDRRVVDRVRDWRDPEPFFRGMLVETGYPLTTIEYHRPERAGGVSKNNLFSLFGFALSGVVSSSKGLLRFPVYIALAMILPIAVTFAVLIVDLIEARSISFLLISLFMQIFFSVICFFLGLMGDHIRTISDMVRGAPLVIERERVNFPTSPQATDVTSSLRDLERG